jgi:hypothetical protein
MKMKNLPNVMRNFRLLALSFSITASVCSLLGQGTLTITFDGPPPQPPGTGKLVPDYLEGGVLFTPVIEPYTPGSLIARSGGGMLGFPENGSAYILSSPLGMAFSFVDGSLFGIRALDLAAFSEELPEIVIQLIGYRLDSTTISTSFDGYGIEWRTVEFDEQWASGLARVEIAPGVVSWSIDNLVVIIPEPASGSLFVLGTAATFLLRSRLRRTVTV